MHESRVERRSGTGLALIVGGLVVAVAFIAWIVFGSGDVDLSKGVADPDVNVEVQGAGSAGGVAESAGDAAEEAAEGAEPAPADGEADGEVAPPQ